MPTICVNKNAGAADNIRVMVSLPSKDYLFWGSMIYLPLLFAYFMKGGFGFVC